jgi:iron only hydrogenase large subunit-like protein
MIQDKGYNPDQLRVLSILQSQSTTCLMVAPSFVVDFDYKTFVPLMKALGFDFLTELTFGAKVVNQQYHKYISENKNKQEKFISSVCPASVALIKAKYPELKKYLLPFDSPMVAMAKIVDMNWPNQKNVFLAPCYAKKQEAKRFPHLIHATITFAEMKEILSKEKTLPAKVSHLFDRFYNDYTKIYPLSGGLSATLHSKDILKKEEMISGDGCKNIQNLFDKNSKKKFYDILFCDGGCIGGNGVSTRTPIFMRKYSVLSYRKLAKKESSNGKIGVDKYTKGIDFSTKF